MDGSLLGAIISAIIGAIIALLSVFFTAKFAYKYNSKLEEDKLIREKKEKLYMTCELVKQTFLANYVTITNVVIPNIKITLPEKKDNTSPAHPLRIMEMLINIYFPALKTDLSELLKITGEFHKYYSRYVTPNYFSKFSQEEQNQYLAEAKALLDEINKYIEKIQDKLSK